MAVSKLMLRPIAAAVTILASCGVHAEASYSETVRLVRSMREDELFMAGLQFKLAAEAKAGKAPRHAACLAQIRYPLLTDAIALGISSQLTDAEVAEGIEFYRSPLGRKFLDHAFREVTENLPPSTDHLSADEKVALAKFARRPAGRKLLQDPITQGEAVSSKVKLRLRMAFEDCAAADEPATEGFIQPESCTTAPLASPDNGCSVEQVFNVYPQPAPGNTTSVMVSCPNQFATIASYKGRVDGIALKWLDARTVEVAAPRGSKLERETNASKFRVAFKELPAAEVKPQQCWPNVTSQHAGSVQMDELQSMPFWMSYGDEERCILSKRMETAQLPGAQHDAVVQFRRVKSAEFPFATRQLVLFERFSTQVPTRSIRIRGIDGEAVELKGGGPRAGFHLIGASAENVLKQFASGAALTLEVQPVVGAAFAIPLPRTDLNWAHASFDACQRSL